MQTRNINLRRSTVGEKANLVVLCTSGMVESGYIENYDGEGITIQNGVPKHQRTAKAAQQRERRAGQQRLRRAQAAQAGQGSPDALEATVGPSRAATGR